MSRYKGRDPIARPPQMDEPAQLQELIRVLEVTIRDIPESDSEARQTILKSLADSKETLEKALDKSRSKK